MANPRGQQRDKPFRDALRLELAAAGEDQKALRAIAKNLIAEAQKTDNALGAIREIADRMDGKVPQGLIGGDEDDNPIRTVTEIRTTIIDPRDGVS